MSGCLHRPVWQVAAVCCVAAVAGCGDVGDVGDVGDPTRATASTPPPSSSSSDPPTDRPRGTTPGDTAPPPNTTAPVTRPTDPPSTPPPSVTEPADAAADNWIVRAAVDDLRAMLGRPDVGVDVVSFEAVTWPDGSIGCPQPGMSYTQALVEGSLTILSVDGREYRYHQGGRNAPFHCPTLRVPDDVRSDGT